MFSYRLKGIIVRVSMFILFVVMAAAASIQLDPIPGVIALIALVAAVHPQN